MTKLLDLPTELLVMIAKLLVRDNRDPPYGIGKQDVYSFAKACRLLYAVAGPVLFDSFELHHDGTSAELQTKYLEPLSQTSQGRPVLWLYLKTFSLFLQNASYPDREDPIFYLRAITRHCNSLGNVLLRSASNLRRLDTPYPMGCDFLNHSWPSLRKLSVISSDLSLGGGHPTEYEPGQCKGLDLSFLPGVLQSPRLKHLRLMTTMFSGQDAVAELKPKTSSLTGLDICTNEMTDGTMLALLRCPKQLDMFRLSSNMWNEYEWLDYFYDDYEPRPGCLPSLTTIYEGLKQHTHTIHSLSINGAAYGMNRAFNSGHHSFRDFFNLIHLETDVTMLLRWQNCRHCFKLPGETSTLHPRELGSLLPASLCELTLWIDVDYRQRHGDGYVYQILLGIVDEQDRLDSLEDLTFYIHYPHCDNCFRRTNDKKIGKQEMEQAKALINGRKMKTKLLGPTDWSRLGI